MENITSAALVAIIEDTILRMNLNFEHCCGQCYDGASATTGAKMVLPRLLQARSHEPSSHIAMGMH